MSYPIDHPASRNQNLSLSLRYNLNFAVVHIILFRAIVRIPLVLFSVQAGDETRAFRIKFLRNDRIIYKLQCNGPMVFITNRHLSHIISCCTLVYKNFNDKSLLAKFTIINIHVQCHVCNLCVSVYQLMCVLWFAVCMACDT